MAYMVHKELWGIKCFSVAGTVFHILVFVSPKPLKYRKKDSYDVYRIIVAYKRMHNNIKVKEQEQWALPTKTQAKFKLFETGLSAFN